MNFRARSVVPSALLAFGGTYVVFLGVAEYLGPGDGIGFLPEIALAVHLLLGGATYLVGGYAVVYDRLRLPLTMLASLATTFLTFRLDVYGISTNTQLTVSFGLALIVAASAASWILSGWLVDRGTRNRRPN